MPRPKGHPKTGGRKSGTPNKTTVIALESVRHLKAATASPEERRSRREYAYLRKYGITIADYDRMLEQQDYKCAACGSADAAHWTGHFCIDHDHETGRVRELLCVTCNAMVGYVEKQSLRLSAVITYVERHGSAKVAKISNGSR